MIATLATKRCARCKVGKPLAQFSRSRKAPGGLYAYCKPCAAEAYKEWASLNPGKIKAYARANQLSKYGLTPETYEVLLVSQEGRCAICGCIAMRDPRGLPFFVDHDHKTGRVRGLLCSTCNFGIGLFFDQPAVLIAAGMYLLEHKENT